MRRTTIESLVMMTFVVGALGGMAMAQPQAPAGSKGPAAGAAVQESAQGRSVYAAQDEAPFTDPTEVTAFVKLVDAIPLTSHSFEHEGTTYINRRMAAEDVRTGLGAPDRTEDDGSILWIYELGNGYTGRVRFASDGGGVSNVWVIGPGAKGDHYFVYGHGC
jgi:hypothetical protein